MLIAKESISYLVTKSQHPSEPLAEYISKYHFTEIRQDKRKDANAKDRRKGNAVSVICGDEKKPKGSKGIANNQSQKQGDDLYDLFAAKEAL